MRTPYFCNLLDTASLDPVSSLANFRLSAIKLSSYRATSVLFSTLRLTPQRYLKSSRQRGHFGAPIVDLNKASGTRSENFPTLMFSTNAATFSDETDPFADSLSMAEIASCSVVFGSVIPKSCTSAGIPAIANAAPKTAFVCDPFHKNTCRSRSSLTKNVLSSRSERKVSRPSRSESAVRASTQAGVSSVRYTARISAASLS